MVELLRTRRFRMPFGLLLLLITQVAFGGQTCRAVMLDMSRVNGFPGTQYVAAVGMPSSVSDEHACCGGDAPPPSTCVVAIDAAISTALGVSHVSAQDLAPAASIAIPNEVARRSWAALPQAAFAAGPPLPAYIVFSRFLS